MEINQRMCKMKKTLFVCLLILAVSFVGCMSKNKTWLKIKELESKEAASAVVEGPASINILEGGKATFGAGK